MTALDRWRIADSIRLAGALVAELRRAGLPDEAATVKRLRDSLQARLEVKR